MTGWTVYVDENELFVATDEFGSHEFKRFRRRQSSSKTSNFQERAKDNGDTTTLLTSGTRCVDYGISRRNERGSKIRRVVRLDPGFI